jgi:hypothetical protein
MLMRRGLAPRRECGQRYDGYDIRAMAIRGDTSERLAQDIEDMALELRQLIQEQDAMVRQRDLPRHGPLAATDQAHIGDGVVGSPERAHGDDGGAPPGEAGDAMDAGGLQRVARRIAGRMGARRRASIDVPAR